MNTNRNNKSITELARDLRKNPTLSEKIFWEHIRKRRFLGLKFLRQFVIVHEEHKNQKYFYIADFYCAEKKLIIELDGEIHIKRKEYDQNRDFVLTKLGFNVVRFNNDELNDIEKVFQKIKSVL